MPEFERGTDARRQPRHERVEQGEILPKKWRQLKQQRAELVAERPGDFAEPRDRVARILQPAVMGDPPRRLERDLIRRRRLRGPAGDEFLGRHPVERVVDLDRRKTRGVVRQHLRRGEIGGIETSLPLGVVVAGGADPNHVD